ncbi:MAG: hypothetical protein JF615_05390 [Asticcacaulis sp.]|nr:hypothetical protein [Asticcacaulis sp.]
MAPESAIAGIRRQGITATRFEKGSEPPRGLFCFPVLPDFFVTHQWLHEVRRDSRGRRCGVYFRIADTQTVHVGRYQTPHKKMEASEAVALLRDNPALGFEVIVPRSVTRSEILRIKSLPQVVGWRVYPEAKGRKPVWPFPGSYRAKKIMEGIAKRGQREAARYYARFPAEWYADE